MLAFSAHAYHGKPVTIIGTTSPDALVTVRIPKQTLSKPVIADEEGRFMVTFDLVEPGIYELIVSAMKDGAANEMSQLIGVPESEAVQSVSISEINLPLMPVKPIKKQKADLDGDGRVNLVDISILLFYWLKPAPQKGDLNGDGVVNLKDVSLMLANWTN